MAWQTIHEMNEIKKANKEEKVEFISTQKDRGFLTQILYTEQENVSKDGKIIDLDQDGIGGWFFKRK